MPFNAKHPVAFIIPIQAIIFTEGVAVAPVFSHQYSGAESSELDTQGADSDLLH